MDNIKQILIVVELEDGTAHQVLASKEAKEMALNVVQGFSEYGSLILDKELDRIELTLKNE